MGWHAHPDVLVMVVVLVGLYWAGARAGGRSTPVKRVTRAQAILYSSGVAVLYLGAGSPIHDISERYLFSIHMLQHLLFTLVAPPLMLLGTPGWMVEPLLRHPRVRRVAFSLTRMFPAFFIFNAVILVTHLQPVVDLSLRSHWTHFVLHLVLVATALLMWMPIFSPTPQLPRAGDFAQTIYLFVQSLVPATIASFLVFAEKPVYSFYTEAPRRMWGLSVVTDQQIAAVIMKLGGGTLIWGIMAVLFFRWFSREERETQAANAARAAEADVRWVDVEAELERMGLTKH